MDENTQQTDFLIFRLDTFWYWTSKRLIFQFQNIFPSSNALTNSFIRRMSLYQNFNIAEKSQCKIADSLEKDSANIRSSSDYSEWMKEI